MEDWLRLAHTLEQFWEIFVHVHSIIWVLEKLAKSWALSQFYDRPDW